MWKETDEPLRMFRESTFGGAGERILRIFNLIDIDPERELIEYDKLMLLGVWVHKQVPDIAAVSGNVIQWVAENPSERRVEIAVTFFNGFWREPWDRQPASDEDLRLYISIVEEASFPYGRESVSQSLIDLLQSPLRPDLRSRIERSLGPGP